MCGHIEAAEETSRRSGRRCDVGFGVLRPCHAPLGKWDLVWRAPSPHPGNFGRVQALFTVKGIGPIVTIFNRRGMGY
jgi:hypothetical protein